MEASRASTETNVLRLRREDEGYPWIAGAGGWLYCTDCFDRYISTNDRARVHHAPFRDKVPCTCARVNQCLWLAPFRLQASQVDMKPTWNQRKRQHEATEQQQGDDDPIEDPAGVLDLPAGDPGVVSDAPVFDFEDPNTSGRRRRPSAPARPRRR